MKKNKIVALIVVGIILLQIVIPSLSDIDWNVVFAEEINTWDISQNGDGSVMATLSDDGTLTISGNGEMKFWNSSYVVAWDSNRKNIKNVIINNGVTSIGNFAFHGCENLINITIPDSVTSIGLCAFEYCSSLTNITIPNSVTSIGKGAFSNCTSLTSINVDSNNEKYMSDKGVLYTKDKKSLIQYPCKKEGTEYIILQGVTSIGYGAFSNCTSLTSITIPNGVTSIGNFAFCRCTNLTNITVPNSVTSIGWYAFYCCTYLTNITIPNSVTSIGDSAFKDCTSLTSITIPNSVTSICGYAFEFCSSLTSITIPNSVTSIGDSAFKDCTSLTSITIPNSVTSIGNDVFNGCISLTSINVDSNNEKYMSDNGVLYTKDKKILIKYPGKKEGTEYLILQGVESIEDYAFYRCTSLTNITIPNSVTSIGQEVFSDCRRLTNITIPNSVTSIGSNAFEYCRSLTNIVIPSSVTSIGYLAFYDCESLTSINVDSNNEKYMSDNGVLYTKDKKTLIKYPSKKDGTKYIIMQGVASIGDYAFEYCRSLTSITIPNSVTSIGKHAFEDCRSLTNITIPNNVTSIGDYAFNKCDSLSVLCKSNSYAEQYAKENNIKYVIDDSVPTIKNVTGNPIQWIKNKVTLTVNAEDSLSGLATEAYSFDNGQTWQKENAKTYTENIQGVIIKVRDAVGNVATSSVININKIDNQAPTIKSITGNPTQWTKDKVTLTVNAEDSLSGLATEAYSFDNGQTWQKENTKTYTENTQGVIIKVRDAVGNVATSSVININKMDNQAPTIKNVTGNPTQWTKNKVILTVNAEDSLSGLATEAYSFDNGKTWQKENTKTYMENTQGVIVKVRDTLGNVATSSVININKIDNQAPTIKNVTGNEKWTKDKVILTVNAEDNLSGLATEAYSFDNGQTWQKENAKTYTENTQGVIIKVRDAVGNVATSSVININKIDNQAPTIKNVTGNEKWTKDKVILTVNAEDSLSGLATEAYSFDNGQTWQKENTKTYTKNTQGIIIKVRDAIGNVVTYKTIDINNILKIEIGDYEKITKDNNEYLTKIEANTTIAQLKEKIKTNGTIKVLKDNNEITDTNTLVGTGMQIQIETEKYIAIVKADLNGDGKIGLSDLSNIKFSLIGKKQLSTEAQMAGDINGDGKVSLSDMVKLKMYLLGKVNI